MSSKHDASPIERQVLSLLRAKDDSFWFDDAGVAELVTTVGALDGEPLLAAAGQLLRLAHFLDVEKKAPAAAATLLTLMAASHPRLVRADASHARSLLEQAGPTADRLAAFSGDARVTKVLDSGSRPEGTVPAGPLARFVVQKK